LLVGGIVTLPDVRCVGGRLRGTVSSLRAYRLVDSFWNVHTFRKSRSVHPAQCVSNLKTCKANTQPHQVLRASTREHCHVPARFQHAHALFPHGRRWHKTIPVSPHESTTLSRHRHCV